MPSDWILERTEPGPHLKLFEARYDYMRNPRNGITNKLVILESVDSANVVALTPELEMVMVRQYRFGIRQYTLELPGGLVDKDEALEKAAARELLEETGYAGTGMTYLGKVASNPVFMDAWIHHFVVQEASLQTEQRLDDAEEVYVELVHMEEVRSMLHEGAFEHPHVVTGLLRFFTWWDTQNGTP